MATSHTIEAASVLEGYRYLNLTTFRKNGAPVTTTVWFAQADNTVYLWTAKTSGKVKRIRNNPRVQITPSTHLGRPRGACIEASARLLPADEQRVAAQALDQKYGWQKRLFALIWRLQRREDIYIEIAVIQE